MAQNDCGRQDDIMSKNGNDERCFQILQSNSGVYGGPETGSSSSKKVQVEGVNDVKLLVNALDG